MMTSFRAVLATIAVVLAGCSSGSQSPPPAVPLPTIDLDPSTMESFAGPYPVVAVLPGLVVQLDRGRDGGMTTVGLLGAVGADERHCFGAEAAAEAHRLLDGQRVRVVGDSNPGRTDAEGRPLAYVWLESGRMANDLLVEGGFAREAAGVEPYAYRSAFARSEELARTDGRGLWSAGACSGNVAKPASR